MPMANESYNLGGGMMYFAEKQEDGSHGPFLWWGRLDEDLKITMELDTLPHPNFNGKLEEIDDEVEIKKTLTMPMVTDDMSLSMTARFFRGENTTTAQVGATLLAESMGEVKQGGIYESGFIAFEDLTLDTYTEGTDYTVDLGAGTFSIVVGGGIVDDTVVAISGTYKTVSFDTVEVGTKTKLEGKFKFISEQTTGSRIKATMHKCSVIPSGDFALIGTKEWKKCSFNVTILKDETITAADESKYMKIEEIAA